MNGTDISPDAIQIADQPLLAEVLTALQRRLAERADGDALDAPDLVRLVNEYLRHLDPQSASTPAPRDLAGLIAAQLDLAVDRVPGGVALEANTPQAARDGWSAKGASVVQVVLDDQPFIVDTLSLTLAQLGWSVDEIIHPQLLVHRDAAGHLLGLVDRPAPDEPPSTEPGVNAESWVGLLVRPPLGSRAEDHLDELLDALGEALDQLDAVGDDAEAMRERARNAAVGLRGNATDAARAAAMLEWLAGGHFIFLGYREYEVAGAGELARFTPVPATGLGILRGDDAPDAAFDALPEAGEPQLLVVTKDSVRSRIHRAAYRDYIGVRLIDADGRVVGEHRFLGLFTASAAQESVARVPYLAGKVSQIASLIGYRGDSYGGQAVRRTLESFPRDELYQAPAEQLAAVVEQASQLSVRDGVRLFVRVGRWQRFVTIVCYLPRDRYSDETVASLASMMLDEFGGESVSQQATVDDSAMAIAYFMVQLRPDRGVPAHDVAALEERVDRATRGWDDEFIELAGELGSEQRGVEFDERYRDDHDPATAIADLLRLNEVAPGVGLASGMYTPADDDTAEQRLKLYCVGRRIALSDVLPHLASLGVRVLDERPYELELRGTFARIYDFGLDLPDFDGDWDASDRDRFMAAFEASLSGATEADELNRLVTTSHLDWRRVGLLRALSRYLQQVGTPYSQSYIAATLLRNSALTIATLRLFELRFDPDRFADAPDQRAQAVEEALTEIRAGLDQIPTLDDDRILRQVVNLVQALVRTNFYTEAQQAGRTPLALKLLPRELDSAPQPRPEFEIYVYSPRVEGVHLRFGKVARGGLRWSDRAEDYRTEVLGLVKAQMVKNTVIVPVGAKGGFYPKRLRADADRVERATEGLECYRTFITGLLSVTDNVVDGEVRPPARVVRADGDDFYLVVAADKGTATFSDEANAISTAAGFWLGDAFASGGSHGYDHKEMGITARGAWESVKRHFAERGIDCQTEDFTCVGIGDMSGDVFGNGMLASRHTRLVAAFNHQHIFLDPTPDATSSFTERQRLFDLPRSTWADYDASLISAGGGVFERTVKAIPISPEVRNALGLADDVGVLNPNDLISAILRAPVDLLWNGGIGTYVKAASESNEQVGDKANDSLRVNGGDLRAACVGEGGNLGCTQLGRIEYARAGGRINTDFIDNSGGVDTSDREVNIKILLDAEVAAGRLTTEERNDLLPQMIDDVAALVLRSNIDQNASLANAAQVAVQHAGDHEHLMVWLTEAGYLRRELEFLPSTAEMEARIAKHEGLTSPELAVLLSYVKILLTDVIVASDLPDDPYLADRLTQYFPTLLRERFADRMPSHRLAREIITTVAVNRFVDSQGISSAHRLADETGASFADVMRSQLAARAIFNAAGWEVPLRNSGLSAAEQTSTRLEIRNLVERATRWLLHDARSGRIDVQATIDAYRPGVAELLALAPTLIGEPIADAPGASILGPLAGRSRRAHLLLPIVRMAKDLGLELELAARVFFAMSERIGADALLVGASQLPRTNRWEIKARAAMRDELHAVQEAAATQALQEASGTDPDEIVDEWFVGRPQAQSQAALLAELDTGPSDLARFSVGLRSIRSLLG